MEELRLSGPVVREAEIGRLGLSQPVVKLQRHFEVAASELRAVECHLSLAAVKVNLAWNGVES